MNLAILLATSQLKNSPEFTACKYRPVKVSYHSPQVLLSERPEYNDKVRAGFLLAPAVIMTNAYNAIFLFTDLAEVVEDIFHWLGFYEFLPHPGEKFKTKIKFWRTT